jgi:hypothetical protein
MGQMMRIGKAGEPWELITLENQERAAVAVYSKMGNYPRFRIIRFMDSEMPWEEGPKERSLHGRYSNVDEKELKRYVLDDGLYLMQWSEVAYREDWTPVEVCHGSYWQVIGGRFKPVRVSPEKIAKAYREFKEEYATFERRKQLEVLEGGQPNK